MIPPYLILSNIRYVLRVKWNNPGKGVAPPLHLGVVANEKGAFWLPSTTVAKFTSLTRMGLLFHLMIYLFMNKFILFYIYASLGISAFYYFNIIYIFTDQILWIDLSDSSQKCHVKLFFLPIFFLYHANLIVNYLYCSCIWSD